MSKKKLKKKNIRLMDTSLDLLSKNIELSEMVEALNKKIADLEIENAVYLENCIDRITIEI